MNPVTLDQASAELAVLAAVMDSNGECLADIALTGDDFNDKRHGDLFDLMRTRHAEGKPVDPVSLDTADSTIGMAFLFSVLDHAAFRYAVQEHADIVARHGMLRRLRSVAAGLMGISSDAGVEQMLEHAQALIDGAAGERKSRVQFVADILPSVIDEMNSPTPPFVPTPWKRLDEMVGGLRNGAVYVVGARPGVGKTVVAMHLAKAMATAGVVAFNSLEMNAAELVKRMISADAQVETWKVANNRLDGSDWAKVERARAEIEATIAIDDRASIGPIHIREHARQVGRHGHLSGIVVDYLQLMSGTKEASRYEAVSNFSRQMKLLAKDLNVPVVVLSQLNRQAAAGQPPRLSDLRESGAIEQDADVVILLNREMDGDHPTGEIALDVAKNRHGPTGVVTLAWQGHFSRVMEMPNY